MPKKIPDKWLYIPIVLLGLYFFIRLIDQSKLMTTFPFDFANDIPAYMASLFFLAKCGFHKFCPYWYNGFISFKTFFPGWQFFTYPIYKLSQNILFSTYLSIVLMYILSFFFIFLLGKNEKFSITKRITFFLLFFTNAINVGNFFKLGRVSSLFGWCMFLGIAMFVFYYRKNKLNKYILLFIPLYFFTILSHPQEAFLSSILILSLLLVKKNIYERLLIILAGFFSVILTSFWWIPFILNLFSREGMIGQTHQSTWLWATSGPYLLTSITAFFVPLTFFIVFYFYWLSKNKSKKELLFFSPIILLNTLFFFRLTPIIPLLNNISPDPYIIFFIFFIIYFFLNIDTSFFKIIKKIIPYALIGIILISIGISHFKTPYFVEHSQINENTLEILEYIDGNFKFLNIHQDSYSLAYYSYAPIYLNLTTASGYYPFIPPEEYFSRLRKVNEYLMEKNDCETFIKESKFFNVTNIVAYETGCQKLKNCRLKKVKEKGIVCLYELNLILNAS